MKRDVMPSASARALTRAGRYGAQYRDTPRPVHPTAGAEELRQAFCIPLEEDGVDSCQIIDELIAAAEPGLVGNTDARFFAWVMGASDPTGVAADWLTSIWGQNAGIYQTSPAAAIAEEAVSGWLLDLLDLPRECTVGLTTGATMAAFTCLAAARRQVLTNAGWDIDADGIQGAPLIHIFLSDDTHITNFASMSYLGFGMANFRMIPSDSQGVMQADLLAAELAKHDGPKIILAQAGHINSGGFDDFERMADLAARHGAWLHVDGAFGLWLRTTPEAAAITRGLDRADSWSVDGHKWLQIPYDSGFAIVRHGDAHRRAMSMEASYIRTGPTDGRIPATLNPELSRRARGFAAWAVMRRFGRRGIREMVSTHCALARELGAALANIPGIRVLNRVVANQVIFTCPGQDDSFVDALCDRLNATGEFFLRPADWQGHRCIRVSVLSGPTGAEDVGRLAPRITEAMAALTS